MAHGIGRTKGGRNTKLHAVCDEKGRPCVLLLTPGNVHDCKVAQLCIEAMPPSAELVADKGYDSQAARDLLVWTGITPQIPSRGTPTPAGLGRVRWPVERTISWLKQFRRLRIRWDRTANVTQAFIAIACSLIAWRYLNN